ncbi:Helicase C-terminal [Arabidopsis thaliana x Arabidopsis arenosa]|uniref:RNA helicase n=1 Tax=Arabidopsis thaliana x Arabidopsis arenosa TaxID=1240361 RepID=A0A8T2BHG6_9BRAS|nr:Helicase C-terminal [Arabidopsis thaliana x Arabidopsis arenosa]
MAPKKKPHKKKQSNNEVTSSSIPNSGHKKPSKSPKLLISPENEDRLRRLLLNFRRTPSPVTASLSVTQKRKKLNSIYENLSCEGFLDDQIELALSSLRDGATLETSLDWLCLNLPSHELPVNYSNGASRVPTTGRSVAVISTSRKDWNVSAESVESSVQVKEETKSEVLVRVKSKRDEEEDSLSSCQSSQADWIRQYMKRLEEEELESSDDEGDKVSGPRPFEVITKDYCLERSNAIKAKRKGDKSGQRQAGLAICKLKQEMNALGPSEAILESEFQRERQDCEGAVKKEVTSSMLDDDLESVNTDALFFQLFDDLNLDANPVGSCKSEETQPKALSLSSSGQESVVSNDSLDDLDLGDLFVEDVPPYGEAQKIPKALLHQLCQRSGWVAPKFNKVTGEGSNFSYTISVMRKSSGFGKSRQAGGLVTIQLPHHVEDFKSIQDAQNRVAAFALHKLFSDMPVHFAITEPYASLVLIWKQEESLGIQSKEEERRAKFVDSLLEADNFSLTTSSRGIQDALPMVDSCVKENDDLDVVKSNHRAKRNFSMEAECSSLKQKQENKKKMQKYKDMLKTRAALPISEVKKDILQKLKEKDVLVVCGETGSGKTTQVPQFILDDMIDSGHGGYCNIICTQPRVLAAISVAQRVADERCEPPPGFDDSLVAYQVRHQNERSDKTRLLFCTTGILLRKLVGDKTLKDVTHIIVDEVHERSLMGDFLLIILKSLIEKQSWDNALPKLKVILMSATVDAHQFSRYFGQCPIITAQGRTHPVTTYFLEDIYERTKYLLASDSHAALSSDASITDEDIDQYLQLGSVNVRRGKKNLMLAGWGDSYLVSEDGLNSSYDSSNYESYSDHTRKNLKRLNEDIIDYELLEELICHIDDTCEEGAILVFLPGMAEINMLLNRLAASYRFRGPSGDWLLPLHSSIASTEQRKVFLRPPKGIRKVIIATNIAETSITIDDVVYVIDSGKHKENRYNPQKKLSSMVEDWVSKANARQRMGRAGRVKPGHCFSLYTRHRFEKLMRPYQVPEMLRVPLVELCLHIKLLGLGHIKPFLSKALEPPSESAINSAILLLQKVGALEGDEELTPLGHHLAKLPVDLLIGKMLLYGGIFGCLSPILSIAAFLSCKSPFVYSKDEQNVDRVKLALLSDKLESSSNLNINDRQSDHLLVVVAYEKWVKILHEQGFKAAERFCESKFLNSSVMRTIRDRRVEFGFLLADIGLINLPKGEGRRKENLDVWFSDKTQPFNMYSQEPEVVKAILCAGLCPNIAEGLVNRLTKPAKETECYAVWHDGKREVHIDRTSINKNCKAFQYPLIVFLEKVQKNKLVYLQDTTVVSPFSILLFGGSVNVHHQSGSVTIDGWLKLTAPAQTAVLFKELRLTLHSILKDLIRKPEKSGIVHNEVVKAMVHLLIEEGRPQHT